MFTQFTTATAKDAGAVEAHVKRWFTELAPGAEGWQLTIGGVTPEGRVAAVTVFDTEDNARRNSQRVEQDRWWREGLALFAGDPEVVDSTEVEIYGTTDIRDLDFVQIIRGRSTDPARARELARQAIELAMLHRPEILDVMLALDGDTFVQTVGFSSEAEARAGERKPLPDDLAAVQAEVSEVIADLEYFDLPTPALLCSEDLPG